MIRGTLPISLFPRTDGVQSITDQLMELLELTGDLAITHDIISTDTKAGSLVVEFSGPVTHLGVMADRVAKRNRTNVRYHLKKIKAS